MSIKSAVVLAAALVTLGMGSAAFASPVIVDDYGTGNSQPVYYDSQGGLHDGNAMQGQSGTDALAMAPRAHMNRGGSAPAESSCFASPASANFSQCTGD